MLGWCGNFMHNHVASNQMMMPALPSPSITDGTPSTFCVPIFHILIYIVHFVMVWSQPFFFGNLLFIVWDATVQSWLRQNRNIFFGWKTATNTRQKGYGLVSGKTKETTAFTVNKNALVSDLQSGKSGKFKVSVSMHCKTNRYRRSRLARPWFVLLPCKPVA